MTMIVAQSTPIGRGAIAVLRMSGDGCKDALKKYFFPFPSQPNELRYGTFKANGISDSAMLVYFDAPKSYTGEQMAELHLHGGSVLVREVIQTLLFDGFVMAQNGEFTKRAFLNGKTNLSKAEGLIDLIDAESTAALRAASALSQNKLGKKIQQLQDTLTEAQAAVEAALDYPEENLEETEMPRALLSIKQVKQELTQLLSTAQEGKCAKYGIKIVLCGKPNTGKSSLLNSLVGFDRAIVSDQSGTTRDTIEESIDFKGLRFVFVDTAGLTQTQNLIEQQGVNRAKAAISNADLTLFVTDDFNKPQDFVDCLTPKLWVKTKSDLDGKTSFDDKKGQTTTGQQPDIEVSALTNKNITALKQLIFDKFNGQTIVSADLLLTSARHTALIKQAADALDQAQNPSVTADIVAAQIREAWSFLGQITGNTDVEVVVDTIFSRFCLGK